MKKYIVGLVVVLLALFGIQATIQAASGTGQETCPTRDGWFKYDGLSGHEFTYPETLPEGATVENCVKYATTVVYGTGSTVYSDGKHEISHASFRVVLNETPEEPPVTEEPEEEEPVVEEPGVEPCPDDSMVPSAGGGCYPCESVDQTTGECEKEPNPELPDHHGDPEVDKPDEIDETPVAEETPTPSQDAGFERTSMCLGGALVTKTTRPNGNSSTSVVNSHPSCSQTNEAGEYYQEEGF